jgi:UDP-glucose 4-epimerase
MNRCLVTGHKGYIGSKVFKRLKKMGCEVMGIDLKDENSGDIRKALRQDDSSDFDSYYDFQPEYIFHLACWPRIGLCLSKPVLTMQNNVLAGSIVLNFANKCESVKRVIYSSSSSVVGDGDGPTNPYALQKLTTETEARIYAKIFNVDTVSLRYFNVYSECQEASGPYSTAIANWMHYIRTSKTPYISGDGEQRRDMVHVEDVVSANIFAMERQQDFNGVHFDVGTGNNISLNEIRDIILKYHDVDFNYVDSRPGEVSETRANTQPLKELGWSAMIGITEGIDKCFNFEVKYER